MDGYVPGEQPGDPAVVKLNTNENPYPPAPGVLEVLQRVQVQDLIKYPDPMCAALRARLAEMHGCKPENVFVGNGSDEVLALCTRAFVENDGAIGYFDPSYSLYSVLADIRGVERRPVPLGEEFAWCSPPQDTAPLFFLTNPNAPTGILYARDLLRPFCNGFRGIVVLDEAYVDFSDEDCMPLALAGENVLVARTLSKAYSLAGIRLGYAVGPAPLIGALHKIKDSYNVNVLSQALALAALSDREHMQRNVDRVRATRGRMSRELAGMDFDVTPSQTNFLWVRPRAMPAPELFAELKAARIYVRHFPGETTGDYLRITVGTDEDVDTLLATIRSLQKKRG